MNFGPGGRCAVPGRWFSHVPVVRDRARAWTARSTRRAGLASLSARLVDEFADREDPMVQLASGAQEPLAGTHH